MSFVKEYSAARELQEELNYHIHEANYHSEQYFTALAEAHNHLEKLKEHKAYRKQFTRMLAEVLHEAV
jgi:predicted PolB exonuclease-like 3'-5' exonuclease